MEPKRLFDCLEYQIEKGPPDVMLAGKENGQWKMAQLTFSHLLRPVRLTSSNK